MKDSDYWSSLEEPKAPNKQEVELFRKFKTGKTLLLGETKQLIPLCNEAIDLYPQSIARQGDWFALEDQYDTIIGDGVLNLVGFDLVSKLREHCKTLILRSFTHEIRYVYPWKYAQYFFNFPLDESCINIWTQKGCVMTIWEFKDDKDN